MDSDISLSAARELSNHVCMVYNQRSIVSDDDQLIWNISNSVADAIDCINSNKKFNSLGLVELCRGSAKETQMDRMTFAVSALLIHLMNEREKGGGNHGVNEAPTVNIPDPMPLAPTGPTVKEEELDEQIQQQSDALNGDRVVKEEPLDEVEMQEWGIPRQEYSEEPFEAALPSRKRSADASEMEESPEEKVKMEVDDIKVEDSTPLMDTFTPGGDHSPSTSRHQPAYRIHDPSTSTLNRPTVRIIKLSEASTSHESGPRTIRIIRRGDGYPTGLNKPRVLPTQCKAKDSSMLEQLERIDHKQPNPFRLICEYCDFYCMSKVVLTSHIRQDHPDEFYRNSMPCSCCDFRTTDVQILNAHLNWFYCHACKVKVPLCQGKAHKGSEKRSKLAQLKKEGLKRKDEKTNFCQICHQSLPLTMTMKVHQELESSHEHACRKKCVNPVCDLATKNAGAMQTHERSHMKHRDIRNFKIEDKCPYCDDYIGDAMDYNEHMVTYHKEFMNKADPPLILKCTGLSAAKKTPCPFKCAKVYQMLGHWEKLDELFHAEPAFKFDYDLARSIRKEHDIY